MTTAPKPRVFLPSMLAGPMVLLFLMVGWWASQIPQPIDFRMRDLITFVLSSVLLLPVSAAVGLLPAAVFNWAGSYFLIGIGQIFPLLRFPFFWPVVGGLVAWWTAHAMDMPPEWQFAFSGSGAVCAFLCRIRLV